MDLHYEPLDFKERLMKAEWEYSTANEELVFLRAEVERLREERDKAVSLYNIGAFLASQPGEESALVMAHREVERLRKDVQGWQEKHRALVAQYNAMMAEVGRLES